MTEASGLADVLAARLRALWGTEAEVTGVRPLPGGASRESWDIRVRAAGGAERRLILLRDAGDRTRYPDKNVAVEAAAMTAARIAGVPVAEIYDYGTGALGQAYLLMERLDGETIPRRLLRDEAYAAVRPGLARRLGEVLARIHQVDPDSVPGLPRVDALGQARELRPSTSSPSPTPATWPFPDKPPLGYSVDRSRADLADRPRSGARSAYRPDQAVAPRQPQTHHLPRDPLKCAGRPRSWGASYIKDAWA